MTNRTELKSLQKHPELWQPAYDLAEEQEHDMWRPTHAIVVNNEVRGHIALGSVPLVTMHYDVEKKDPLSLRQVQKLGEEALVKAGWKDHFIVVPDVSPAYRIMETLGYETFPTTIHYKQHGS